MPNAEDTLVNRSVSALKKPIVMLSERILWAKATNYVPVIIIWVKHNAESRKSNMDEEHSYHHIKQKVTTYYKPKECLEITQ